MSDQGTKRLLAAYREQSDSEPMFLASLFQTPERNFHRSELVEIDIRRNDPHIAVPVKSVGSGARHHETSRYTNKGFEPTVVDLETNISAYNGLKRRPGRDPFEDPSFLRDAMAEAFDSLLELEEMIRRTVELMCAQIFQGGAISLVDDTGAEQYGMNFHPKSTHIVTAGATWAEDGSTGAPLTDLGDMAEVLRRDGKAEPNMLIFGTSAFRRFKANPDVQAELDNRRIHTGELRPQMRGGGATFQGYIWIGDYRFEMWTYNKTYIHPQTGAHTPYVGTENVIMLAREGRRDLTFGELPMFAPPESRAAQFLPRRMAMPEIGLGLTTNAWITPNGKHLMLSAGTRPLPIPTAIDTMGVLDVTV